MNSCFKKVTLFLCFKVLGDPKISLFFWLSADGVYGKLVQRQLSKMANELQENGTGKEADIDTLLDSK